MVKVLVVAATGKVGRHVWRQALSAGHTITAYVRSAKKMAEDVKRVEGKAVSEIPNLRVVEGELSDSATLFGACQDQDVVISTVAQVERTAAQLESKEGGPGPGTHKMTRDILDAVLKAGVKRFITAAGSGPLSRRSKDGEFIMEVLPFMKKDPVFYQRQHQHLLNFAMLLCQDPGKLEWTFVSLPVMTGTDEEYGLTGRVVSTQDTATKSGRSTYADAASIIVREITSRENLFHRVGVATDGMGEARPNFKAKL